MKQTEKKRVNRIRIFGFATILLVIWGIWMQYLCEQLGGTPYLKAYLLHLLPAAGIFFLFYRAAMGICGKNWLLKLICWVLVGALLLWILLMGWVIVDLREEEDPYDNMLQKTAVRHLLNLAEPFGKGEFCYEYPDAILEGYEWGEEELPEDVAQAFRERAAAKHYFGDYRSMQMLPVLSYTYGLWVNWLCVVLTVVWCILGAVVCMNLYRWWEIVIYLISYGFVALQMIFAVMTGFGTSVFYPFYPFSGNLPANLFFVTPMLGILFGLALSSTPAPEQMMVPDDAFWNEVIGEE